MFSATVRSPNTSLSSGAKPMPSLATSKGRNPAMSRPAKWIDPDRAAYCPMMVRKVVDLPAPLRPTRQTSSPAPTSIVTRRRISLPSMSTLRSLMVSIGPQAFAHDRGDDMGIGKKRPGRQVGKHLALRQRDNALRIGGDQVHIVLDEDNGFHSRGLGSTDQSFHQRVFLGGGDARSRLIEQDHLGVQREGGCYVQ